MSNNTRQTHAKCRAFAKRFAAGSLTMAVTAAACGQSVSGQAELKQDALVCTHPAQPPVPVSTGLLNDWLHREYPSLSQWDIGGQVRARYEDFDSASPAAPNADFQRRSSENDDAYLWLREKVHVGYSSKWIGGYVEGRNSDAIDDHYPRVPGEDRFELQQAYVTLGNSKSFPITAKVGRQEMLYGDERLIGASDWSNTARSFDAAKLRFENNLFWVDAFAGRVVVPDAGKVNTPDYHDWFFGVYASSKALVPVQESQLYFLSRNSEVGAAVSPRDIYSVGTRVKSLPDKLHGFDYTAEAVGQFGSINQSRIRREQQAFAASGGAGYTWADVFATPRAGIEYNFSTGDSDPTDDKNETLDNLFPTNHKHYGYMDLVGWRNIHNPRAMFSVKPHKTVTVSLDYHLFWLADTHDSFYPQGGSGRNDLGYGRHAGYDSFVGSELDLDCTYSITQWAGLRAGYGHFFTGKYVEQSKNAVGGSVDADWVYVQATLNF